MTSVDSNFNFLCGRPHGAGPPPPSTCVHPSLTPLPLRVDVINGWPLFCPGRFVRGSFVWKVSSGVVLSVPLLSEYICYITKLNITLNFMFHMYDKKFIIVTSHALDPPPPATTVTPSRT